MALSMKALVWTAILVIIQGVIFSKIAGPGLLLHGSFLSRAFVIISVCLTGYLCVHFFYEPKIQSVARKAILVTGCDSGFGNLLARRLDKMGFTVFATCLDPDSEESKNLKEESSRTHVLKMNVTSDSDVMECVNRVIEILREEDKFLWGVVNNAGIANVGLIEMLPLSFFESTFQVNALGTVRVSKAFIPLLRGHGRIVNVTSLASRVSFPCFSAYAMSKYAALAFSDSLRREMLPFGVKVVTIEPGRYKTSIVDISRNVEQFTGLWERTPEHVREAYGKEFLEESSKSLGELLQKSRPEVREVVDTIVEALCLIMPKPHYIPHPQHFWKFKFLTLLPTRILDKISEKTAFPIRPKATT